MTAPSIFVATPAYDASVCTNHVRGALGLMGVCTELGVPVEFYFPSGCALLPWVRNACVAAFLKTGMSHLMFIDADMGFDPQSVLALAYAGHDVVAGVGRMKAPARKYACDLNSLEMLPDSSFARVDKVGAAFMCISREAFLRLLDEKPELHVSGSRNPYRFFDMRDDPDTGECLTEDYSFCALWRSIGGDVYVDTDCSLTHQGHTRFAGNLFQDMKK